MVSVCVSSMRLFSCSKLKNATIVMQVTNCNCFSSPSTNLSVCLLSLLSFNYAFDTVQEGSDEQRKGHMPLCCSFCLECPFISPLLPYSYFKIQMITLSFLTPEAQTVCPSCAFCNYFCYSLITYSDCLFTCLPSLLNSGKARPYTNYFSLCSQCLVQSLAYGKFAILGFLFANYRDQLWLKRIYWRDSSQLTEMTERLENQTLRTNRKPSNQPQGQSIAKVMPQKCPLCLRYL